MIETGLSVSLKEKISRNPLVAKLIGAPVVHTSILYHIQPGSSYYDKENPAKNHQLVTLDKRAAELRELAKTGIQRACVHLDGWGFRGYDNLHPDILPPCPEAGGWEGMRRFAQACDELGYVFAIHDRYRDYYLDAKSYNPGQGPAMGIPVPLFNLVYHDALVLPWSPGRGAWGIPEKDLGFLHGLANAGIPSLSLSPSEEELARVRTMCALHERVGLLELVNHAFLGRDHRRQEFTYADGTKVIIDLDKDQYEISPRLDFRSAAQGSFLRNSLRVMIYFYAIGRNLSKPTGIRARRISWIRLILKNSLSRNHVTLLHDLIPDFPAALHVDILLC